MDMAVANLFKHNVFFRLVAHDPDQYEPLFRSKGYHYASNEIENRKSIGFESAHDVYGSKMRPLFRYIFPTCFLTWKTRLELPLGFI